MKTNLELFGVLFASISDYQEDRQLGMLLAGLRACTFTNEI